MNADKPQTSKLVPFFPVAHIRLDFLCGQYETEDTKIVQLQKYILVSITDLNHGWFHHKVKGNRNFIAEKVLMTNIYFETNIISDY